MPENNYKTTRELLIEKALSPDGIFEEKQKEKAETARVKDSIIKLPEGTRWSDISLEIDNQELIVRLLEKTQKGDIYKLYNKETY